MLQQRVEAASLERRGRQAIEGVGGKNDDGEDADADAPHRRPGGEAGGGGQSLPPQGEDPAEQRQQGRPQQQRAFVMPPGRRHLVEHRLGGMGILRHHPHREIRRREGMDQGRHRRRHRAACAAAPPGPSEAGRAVRRASGRARACARAKARASSRRSVRPRRSSRLPPFAVPLQHLGDLARHIGFVVLANTVSRRSGRPGSGAFRTTP
jgi:hypothetical protein